MLPWIRTLLNSPKLGAVERGDDVGSVLCVGCDPAGFPGFPGGVQQRAGQDVELLGVVKTPSDLHRPVLQLLQLHRAAWNNRKTKSWLCWVNSIGRFYCRILFFPNGSLWMEPVGKQRQNTNSSWNVA